MKTRDVHRRHLPRKVKGPQEESLHVAFVMHSHGCAGAEVHMRDLMGGLLREGFRASYMGPMDSWVGKELSAAGVPCLHVPLCGSLDLYSVWRILSYVRGRKVDIIHSHLGRGTLYGGWVSRLSAVPSVATVHGKDIPKELFKFREKRVIAVSRAIGNHLESAGFPSERVCVVHNGINVVGRDETKRALMRKTLGIRDSERALCMISRFSEVKGHDFLVEAMRDLFGVDLRLFMLGKAQGEWFGKIESMVSDYGLEDRVVFLGHRDDPSDVLQAMDFLVVPSRYESFGLVLLEAMSLGVPVIASDTGGIPEIIQHGENGLLVPVGDVRRLADSIRSLFADSALANRLSLAGRKTVRERFSLENMLDRTIEVYKEALGST